MTSLRTFILSIFLLIASLSIAQQSAVYTSELLDYQKALTLYNNKQYTAAQSLFETIKYKVEDEVIQSDCSYYIANCAVRLNQQNADDLVIRFVEEYPTSTKRNTAFLDVADYYFENSKYAFARKWYDKVEETSIARNERERFYFNYGYSLYATGSKTGATRYLNRVADSQEYGSQAKYYIGYMAYEGDDYDTANQYFEQVSDNEKYKEKLSYYQADLNFKLGKFEKAIELAMAQLPNSDAREKSELSKIIGESYFNIKQYNEAIPYLKAYEGKGGKWNNTDYYQLGYAYYKQNDFESAISEFNKIIDGRNAVAQNAYYHLGESYVKINKMPEALNAFRNASEMDFDLKIQEDAWLNYAKISYDIGNPYQSVPQVLTSYLNKYPSTAFKEELETLLIDSYITSKNYKEALELLKGKNSFENKVAFQKVSFYRGIELYNEAKYNEALSHFQDAIDEAKVPEFTTRSIYWKAETDYNLANYNEALVGFKQFRLQDDAKSTEEYTNIDYSLAYAYFKLKDYNNATTYFKNYLQKRGDDALRNNDAYLRLGDGYFVTSNYQAAIDAYNKAIDINEIETDYAAFQEAMSHGYIGKSDQKLTKLEAFASNYRESGLRDDALYELANTYVKTNQNDKALATYERLDSQHRNSAFISKSLLRQGLVYYNRSDNTRALNKFKKVANDYPNTEEAIQAVATARNIYIDTGNTSEYAAWVKSLGYIEVTNADLDNTTYQAAEKQFLDGNTDKTIRQFNAYLNEFPNGIHALKSHFYLAQLYYQKDLFQNAEPHYAYVTAKPKNEYTEQAMVKLSEIYLSQSNWSLAIPLLQKLEAETDYPQNELYALSNLMKAYYQTEDYTKAQSYANKVLGQSKVDTKLKSDAQIIIARSAIQLGDEEAAKQSYASVESIASGALAAEALYYSAYFKNKEGNYKASNTVAQKLAKDYGSYRYYGAKGLVVMAKNYNALNEAFQANYILESVIRDFQEYDDVVQEAQIELRKIKAQQAKTNSSVEVDNN
ncbi:MAG: tetratricopeptide repeat protein [Winogradskyella sp.]|nr:tetratricopeptide repeat protein [Winogradskyella sp.]